MAERKKRVLFIPTKEISLLDIPRVLDELGYDVYEANYELNAQKYQEDKCSEIKTALREIVIDYVITYDFILTVSQVCMEMGIPYISWIYDAPQMELYMHRAQYPCNYIFSFDKKQVQRVSDIGLKHVMRVPLAVHSKKVLMVSDIMEKKVKQGYEHEICFVGQLYKMKNVQAVLEKLDDNIGQQLEKNVESCFIKWGKDIYFHGQMQDECVEELVKHDTKKIQDICPYMSPQFFYEAAFLSRVVANRERVHILNKLAEKHDVVFYTKDEDTSQLSSNVKIKPGVGYDVLTHLYKKTKINLNITLHCIETGVPQRVLDVMAAGGFMLSNYQEELEEMFEDREEIVLYRNERELEELVEYYLEHDEERERIARKGQEKVLREYDFAPWLTKIFRYVEEQEKDRRDSYINLEAKELRECANQMLSQQKYLELYEIYINPKYDTTIEKNRELLYLRELLKCWRQELKEGVSNIFDNIDNVQQVELKYLEILHCLWRIEQGLSYENCLDSVDKVRKNGNSQLLVAWIIYTNILEQEETFIRFSEFLAEYSVIEAVKFLNAGLRMLEDNQKLLMKQASYLLELKLWEQALKTLQRIGEPTEDVKEIIVMLTKMLMKEV